MLDALVEGYGSSDDDEEEEKQYTTKSDDNEVKSKKPKEDSKAPEPEAAPAKQKLPSASSMMATASSWARPGQEDVPKTVDKAGTRYNAVPPPTGLRAEDGVMGGGGDFIKPVVGASLDSTKVYTGDRTLKKGGPASLVPPQLKGRKNVNTEDVGSWTTDKRHKATKESK